VSKLSPGKLPGLFAAITNELLSAYSAAPDAPVSDYELIVRRQWEKIRQLFIKYGLNLSNEADLKKVGLDANFMMRNNLPQGFRFEHNTADILQYTPLIYIDSPDEGHVKGTVTAVKRAFDGGGWVVTVGFWNLSFNIPDQFVEYGNEADVKVMSNQQLPYHLHLCTAAGGMLSPDRLQERIASRQMSIRVTGSPD
jgi:hypothetical protein